MALKPIDGFLNGSYATRSRGSSACRTVNQRLERNHQPDAKSPFTMFPRSGKEHFATLPTGPGHGAWSNKTRAFFASGGWIYELFQDGTTDQIGQVVMGTNPATMRANGTQLLVCSGGNVYIGTGTEFYQPIVSFRRGVISITGNAAVWQSGDKFVDIIPGHLFMVGANLYTVAAVADDEHLTIVEVAPVPIASVTYQVGDTLLYGATCEYIDGYFVVGVPNSKQFRISAPLDGTIWDALDVAQKSGSTDNIACVISSGGILALLGDNNSTEQWVDSADPDFPFERASGRTFDMAAEAPWSVIKLPDGSIAWVMTSEHGGNQIVRSAGGNPVRISDHAIETALSKYQRISDAVGSFYIERGHWIARWDFPTANRTLECDLTDGAVWSEIGIATLEDEVYAADLARFQCHVTWPDGRRMHLGLDYTSGKVWQISPEFKYDDGVPIPVMRIAPHIVPNLEMTECSAFALDCELGTIDPTRLGLDGKPLIPMVSLFYSDDGGNTWEDAGAASLGRAGEYEGTKLTADEMTDATANSQTNPQTFESIPIWHALGSFYIARTYKYKSTADQLPAVYAGLAELK